jgi:hypothetical protein
MFANYRFALVFTGFAYLVYSPLVAQAAPFSQYGMIQNVQNYSSNPFYNSKTGTITTPKIVSDTGPALKASDCDRAVSSIITSVCSQKNNCKGTTLAEIRPSVMVQLSLLPGYNYASSCVGYIDSAYEKYTNPNAITTNIDATYKNIANVNAGQYTTGIASAPTQKNSNIPKWQQEYNERAAELKALQSETNNFQSDVIKTDFPKTFNDLSFAEKNAIKQQDYEKHKDAQVYVPLNIQKTEKSKSTSSTDDTAQQIANCIKGYDAAQIQVEQSAIKAWEQHKKSPDDEKLKKSMEKLSNAYKQSCLSPCLCTKGLQKQKIYLDAMGVKCDQDFTDQCTDTATELSNEFWDSL